MLQDTETQQPGQPLVVSKEQVDILPVLGFKEPGRTFGGFQNIFASESTPTDQLTLGIARFPARTKTQTAFEALHRHDPAEFYYILSGVMIILLEGKQHRVKGSKLALLSSYLGRPNMGSVIRARKKSWSLFGAFQVPTDGFSGIEYRFSEQQPDWALFE